MKLKFNVWTICAGLFLTCMLIMIGMWIWSGISLRSKIAAIRQQGSPTTWKEVDEFYSVPEGAVDATDAWMAAFVSADAAYLHVLGQNLPLIGTDESEIPPPNEEWAALEDVEKFLKQVEPTMQLVHQAAAKQGVMRRPGKISAATYLQPDVQLVRNVTRVLTLSAHVHAHRKDYDAALADIQVLLQLRDAHRNEVSTIAMLVNFAAHAVVCDLVDHLLPVADWSDAQLQALQQQIDDYDFGENLKYTFRCERGLALAEGQAMNPFFRGMYQDDVIQTFDGIFARLEFEWPEIARLSHAKTSQSVAGPAQAFTFLKTMYSSLAGAILEQNILATARQIVRTRCCVAAIAAQRQFQRDGAYPSSLKEIDGELIGVEDLELTDPFDGQPLRFIDADEAILIYSIGQDLRDDGGEFTRAEDTGSMLRKVAHHQK